jgi:recombination protein RecA
VPPKKKVIHASTIEQAMAIVEKTYGKGTAIWASSLDESVIERTPSGSLQLDISIGGGFANGYSHQLWGDKSSGKTTEAYRAVAAFQRLYRDKVCVWIAGEPFDKNNAIANGINSERLVLIFPEYGEKGFNAATILISSGKVSVMVVDSVDALVSKVEYEGDMELGIRSEMPRLLNRALRKLGSAMQAQFENGSIKYANGLTLIWISQMRIAQNVSWGANPETSSGGKGFGHVQSITIQHSKQNKSKTIWDEVQYDRKLAVGLRLTTEAIKNKTYPPFGTAAYDYYYSTFSLKKNGVTRKFLHGFVDHATEIIDLALSYKILTATKRGLEWNGKSYTSHTFAAYLDTHLKVAGKIIRRICKTVRPRIDAPLAEYYTTLMLEQRQKLKEKNANIHRRGHKTKMVRVGQKRKSKKRAPSRNT